MCATSLLCSPRADLWLKLLTLGVGDSLLFPLFSFSGIDVNGSKKLSPTPSVSE